MRFDNAFLTAASRVGMQFVDQRNTFTVYRDKQGVLHASEAATKEQKVKMIDLYIKMEKKYKPHVEKVGHVPALIDMDSGDDAVPHCGLDCFEEYAAIAANDALGG